MKTNQIYKLVERLGELLKVDARQTGAEHGLLPVQLEVLHYLSSCNKYSDTPMAVTEYLGQTKGTVSQTIKTLEKKELVIKIADDHDKRISHIDVTPSGHKLLSQSIPTAMFARTCSNLSQPQQQEINAALQQLLVTFIKSNKMKSFGICQTCKYNHKNEDGSFYCNLVNAPLTDSEILLICREHENQSCD
ncbi:MAG: winged helix-turn-helix transcriptional regulator [Colwellia sp.]|nr:winged helix-turn-helix transcriptional regulator [Colwellia sp.]